MPKRHPLLDHTLTREQALKAVLGSDYREDYEYRIVGAKGRPGWTPTAVQVGGLTLHYRPKEAASAA